MDFSTRIRPHDLETLERNWTTNLPKKGTRAEHDFWPVIKLFNPVGGGTWLIAEKEPGTSLCFGLCDLGMGTPELGYVCLEELFSLKLIAGLSVEQDIHWRPTKPLSEYASEATRSGFVRA